MRSIKPVLVALLLVLAIIATGCSGSDSTGTTDNGRATEPAEATVVEIGLAFQPGLLDVKVGDTVTFLNEDSAPHNVTFDGVELGTQSPGESVTWTAEEEGTFEYSCTIHPSMTGKIVVR